MQKLLFVSRNFGVAKKSGKDYDMTVLSNGLSSFTVSNGPGVGNKIAELELVESEEVNVQFEVGVMFGALRATIVDIERA